MIQELLLRERIYTTLGFAHLGIVYNKKKGTVIRYNMKNRSILGKLSTSKFPYDACKRTFTIRSWYLSAAKKEELKSLKTGCGYVDFRSTGNPLISCNEVTCKQLATVICQKLPARKMETILVKRLVVFMI